MEWIWQVVDRLASEYGWALSLIEELGLDEALKLLEQIKKRKIAEYKIQLAIVTNPHTEEPEKLWKLFDDDMQSVIPPENSFDKEGLDGLKALMAKGTAFHIK